MGNKLAWLRVIVTLKRSTLAELGKYVGGAIALLSLPFLGGFFFFTDGSVILDQYHRVNKLYLVHDSNYHLPPKAKRIGIEGTVASSNDTVDFGFVSYGTAVLHANESRLKEPDWEKKVYLKDSVSIELSGGEVAHLVLSDFHGTDQILSSWKPIHKTFEKITNHGYFDSEKNWVDSKRLGSGPDGTLIHYGIKPGSKVYTEGIVMSTHPLVIKTEDIVWPGERSEWFIGFVSANSMYVWRAAVGFFIMVLFLALGFRVGFSAFKTFERPTRSQNTQSLRDRKFDEIMNRHVTK